MSTELDSLLVHDLVEIINQGKKKAVAKVNHALILVYWQVGHKINTHILENQRAEYGKEIVAGISSLLFESYGATFRERNVRRMMQFADLFPDFEIVSPLATQLSWSHFVELLPIKDPQERNFYALKSAEETWSKRELRRQIERKAFERKEIAASQLDISTDSLQNTFKDPYFLDFLDVKKGYMENDLESAILHELEDFILELGKGFAFVERQKRLIIDGEDFYLDLLFYHRKLKRLVAIELKLGKFKAAHKGQMELYLKWLNKHEKQDDENHPIGLILCAQKSNEQIELLEMGKDGIVVAEYWTDLPPKDVLEEKIHQARLDAMARIDSKKRLEE